MNTNEIVSDLLDRIEVLYSRCGQLKAKLEAAELEIDNLKNRPAPPVDYSYLASCLDNYMKNPGGKIALIKLHRAVNRSGLRESKVACEQSLLWKVVTESKWYATPAEVVAIPWSPPGV